MQFAEALAQRKAEAGSFGLAHLIGAHLTEFLEHQRQVLCRDAGAGVRHGHFGKRTVHACNHRYFSSIGRELDCVGEQVQQDLLGFSLVAAELAERIVNRALERYAMPYRPLPDQRNCIVECGRKMEPRHVEFHPPRLDLGQIQDVVDERQQVFARGMDVLQVVVLFGVQFAEHPLQQNFGKAVDRIQRSAQFVTYVGEELALGQGRCHRLVAHGAQLHLHALQFAHGDELPAHVQIHLVAGEHAERIQGEKKYHPPQGSFAPNAPIATRYPMKSTAVSHPQATAAGKRRRTRA